MSKLPVATEPDISLIEFALTFPEGAITSVIVLVLNNPARDSVTFFLAIIQL